MTLKRKLFYSYIIIFIIPLLLFMGNLINLSRDSVLEKASSSSILTLQQVASNIDVLLNSAVNISRMVVNNTFVQEYYTVNNNDTNAAKRYSLKAQCRVFFDSIIEPKSNIHSIIIHTPNQDNLVSGRLDERNLTTLYYNQDGVVQQPQMTLTDNWGHLVGIDNYIVPTVDSQVECIAVLNPLTLVRTGLISGYAQINIDQQVILDFYRNTNYPNGGHIFFATPTGRVVLRAEDTPLCQDLVGKDYFSWALANPNKGKVFNIDGKDYLITSTFYSNIEWIAFGIIPMNEITGLVNKQILLSLVFFIFSLITIALFSTIFISHITKPIDNLIYSMKGAAQGDLSVSVDVVGTDEISQLSSSFNHMIEQVSELIEEVYNEKLMKKQSQLLALQSQINPHFLYNSLESIRSLIQLDRVLDAYDMTHSLEVFYRTSLSNGQNIIRLDEEFDNIRHYLQIQKIRYHDKLDYEIIFDSSLSEYCIVKLLIQPLVENAIYHGIRQVLRKGFISIKGYCEDSLIHIEVVDNGIGFKEDQIKGLLTQSTKHYGLYNVNQRIQLYFGTSYGIRIHPQQSGANVEIVLPMILKMREDEQNDSCLDS